MKHGWFTKLLLIEGTAHGKTVSVCWHNMKQFMKQKKDISQRLCDDISNTYIFQHIFNLHFDE